MTTPELELHPGVRQLIEQHLGAIDEIEVLLCVLSRAGEQMSVEDVSKALHKTRAVVEPHLRDLAARGFLAHDLARDTFSYVLQGSELADSIEQLRQMYEERPVALIRALYDRPAKAVQSFADAFRIRKP